MPNKTLVFRRLLAASLSVLIGNAAFAAPHRKHVAPKPKSEVTKPPENPLMDAMEKELNRSFSQLKNAGDAPLYFLSYSVYDDRSFSMDGSYGALTGKDQTDHQRTLSVDLRVGDPKVDNTHKIRGGSPFDFLFKVGGFTNVLFPLSDNEPAIRTALWQKTDAAFKNAQETYRKVKANKEVKVNEDDLSDDFSLATPAVAKLPIQPFNIDRPVWEDRLRKLSAIYKEYPDIHDSSVRFTAESVNHYLVNSEGTKIQDTHTEYRVYSTVSSIADDGMRVWLYDGVEGPALSDLPDDAALEKMCRKLATDLMSLRVAKRAEPYVGPAILRPKAAGVFFHETFGHRIEGHRQKDESEGRTFAKKLGLSVMPSFISVSDDPTRKTLGPKALNGYYVYDDQGVKAEKVVLVDHGILKSFLMGRSPVKGVNKSNGHARCSRGYEPVARQGNLIVDSDKRVPYEKLREMLIEDIKKQGKPYGLIFDEIAGGFTMTQSFLPQSFKLLPLRVSRVYADGRPDELLRGVDIVGTPLASLERIEATGNDDDTFNGTCGAESGWVPVSASSPSLLVGTIEVELQNKAQDKPPLLPAPLFDDKKDDVKIKKSTVDEAPKS